MDISPIKFVSIKPQQELLFDTSKKKNQVSPTESSFLSI